MGDTNSTPNYSGLIGSAVGAAAGLIGAAQQRKFESSEAEKQRLWSEEQTEKANQWSLDMWNRTNEYNTPANQVARLREAGLNPLYYGIDGSSAEGMSASQPLGYDRASASAFVNPISGAIDSALKVAQLSNIQADTAKKSNETLTETQRREKIVAEIDEVRQDIKNKMADEKLTDAQRARLEKDLEWCDRLNEATLQEKKSAAALSDAQKKRIEELLEGEKLLQSKTIEDFDHKWKKISAEISQIAAQNKLLAKDLENYALNHANNGFMGTGLSLTNLLRALRGNRLGDGPTTPYGDMDVNDLIQSGQ